MKTLVKRYSIVIFTLLLLTACGADVDDSQSVVSAKNYIEKNQLQEAYLELKNALQVNPQNAEARYLLGTVNLRIGDSAFAEKEFRKSAEAGWEEGESKVGMMTALIVSHKFKKVLDEIEIKESYARSDQADLFALRAYAEAALGFAGLAKVSLQKGVEIDKNAFEVMKMRVQLDLSKGNLETASEKLGEALAVYEGSAELLLLRAVIAARNDDAENAKQDFQKVLDLEPKSIITQAGRSARVALARLEILEKNNKQAKALLKPLLKQRSKDPEVNFLVGMLAYEEKDYDQAEDSLLKVLRLVPEHPQSLLLFGAVNFAQKDYEQTAYYVGKYLQIAPADIRARKLLGRTYIMMGQQAEAQKILRSGLQQETDAELLALIGMSQLRAGDTVSGITDLKRAVKVSPDSNAMRNELAKAYISAGQTEDALQQLNEILSKDGGDRQAAILKVTAYLRSKQNNQAINTVLDILRKSPEDVAVLSLAGNVFAVSGDSAEARKYFNKALALEPNNLQATMLLAALEESEGNREQAIIIYESLSSKRPELAAPLLSLARLSAQNKDIDGMIAWLEKAREQAPEDNRSRLILAEYYLGVGQHDKAGTMVEEALKINPNEPATLLLKSKNLLAQERFVEALPPLQAMVTRMPQSLYARTLLGETYMMLEEYGDARRQLRLVLKDQPYYVPAILLMSRVEQLTKNYKEAIDYVEQAKKLKSEYRPTFVAGGDISMQAKNALAASEYYRQAIHIKADSETVIKLSEAYIRQGNMRAAIKVLQIWVDKNPDDVRANEFLGNAYLASDKNDESILAFERVYKQQPDNIVALNNLAWLYTLKNDDRSLAFAEKAYKLKAEDGGIQDTYGWALVRQGQIEKGRRMLERAMKTLPGVAEIEYHYAVSVYKSGEKIEAKKLLKKLLQGGQSFTGREDAKKLVSQ